MLTVKNNQPTLFDTIKETFESGKPDDVNLDYNRGHGREEYRSIETIDISASNSGIGRFEAVQQIVRITRRFVSTTTYEESSHVVYAICTRNLEGFPAAAIAQALRKHWTIEVRLHGQRDVRFSEDANKTHIGAAPRALACLRNWAIAIVEKIHRKSAFKRIGITWKTLAYNGKKAIALI